jgi:hypothetical protein
MDRVKLFAHINGNKNTKKYFWNSHNLHSTKERVCDTHVIAKTYPVFDVKISFNFLRTFVSFFQVDQKFNQHNLFPMEPIFVSVVITPSPQAITAVFRYFYAFNIVSPVRAWLIIWWERFRGTQKEDDRGTLSIHSSTLFSMKSTNTLYLTSAYFFTFVIPKISLSFFIEDFYEGNVISSVITEHDITTSKIKLSLEVSKIYVHSTPFSVYISYTAN